MFFTQNKKKSRYGESHLLFTYAGINENKLRERLRFALGMVISKCTPMKLRESSAKCIKSGPYKQCWLHSNTVNVLVHPADCGGSLGDSWSLFQTIRDCFTGASEVNISFHYKGIVEGERVLPAGPQKRIKQLVPRTKEQIRVTLRVRSHLHIHATAFNRT